MCRSRQRDIEDLDNQLAMIECQIGLLRDLIDSLKSSGRDASKPALGLAMLLAMHGQATVARDTVLRAGPIDRKTS